MTDGCEQWWERVKDRWVWGDDVYGKDWNSLGKLAKFAISDIYEAAILPQDEDDRELREQAANLTRHPWERGLNKEETR